MTKFVIQLSLLVLTVTIGINGAPCSTEDKSSLCLWNFLKVITVRDELPSYIKSALQDALIDGILSKKCGHDLPSETVIKAFEKAVQEKIVPACVVDVLKSIRPCGESTTEPIKPGSTSCCSTSATVRPTTESPEPSLPLGSVTTVKVPTTLKPDTTISSSTGTSGSSNPPKNPNCKRPNCETVKDPSLSYPSNNTTTFYRCSQNPETQQWQVIELNCSSGQYFDYLSQKCGSYQPATNVCEEENLPQVTTPAPSPSPTTPAPTPAPTKPTPSPSPTKPALAPASTPPTTPAPSRAPTKPVQTPAPTKPASSPAPTTSAPIPTTTIAYWKLPGFESSRGSQRVWWIPTQYTLIFDETKTKSSEVYAALFKGYNELSHRIVSGQEVLTWMPGYLLEFPPDVQLAFKKMTQAAVQGNKEGDYDFRYPEAISSLIIECNKKGVEVPWEVIDDWKTVYCRGYQSSESATEIRKHLQQSIGQLVHRGVISSKEVDQYSTQEIAEKLLNGAKAEKIRTNNLYIGPNDDIINPLVNKRIKAGKDIDGANRLIQTLSEIDREYRNGKDIKSYIPPTLKADLESFNLTKAEVEEYKKCYKRILARFILKNGSQKRFTAEPGYETEQKWYSPDKRLQPVYQKLIDSGKMDDLVFDTLGYWVAEYEVFVQKHPSLEGYDDFVPATLSTDLDKLNPAHRDVYEQSCHDLRNIIKKYLIQAIRRF